MAIAERKPIEVPAGVRDSAGHPAWGSDLILDMLRLLGIEYAAVLPGSTFRGIHDSAVNYTANQRPELILCNHEMLTVSLSAGYARVTGKPMAAIVHNVVGLLNTSMTIYDAWCGRLPVLILGGTGPVDARRRRPWIDWIHTANVQGNLVRDFTKWDDQPGSVEAIPESLLRAYRIAVTEPAGPVYVCFDVDLQEQALPNSATLPDVARYQPAAPVEPDRGALREVASLLCNAEFPLCFADRVGTTQQAVANLVELAELLSMPVIDLGTRANFPTPHELDFAGAEAEFLQRADVVLGLDLVDLDRSLRLPVDYATRGAAHADVPNQKIIHISMDELAHRGLTAAYQALPTVDLPILANAAAALPLLLEECRRQLNAGAKARIEQRRQGLAGRQQALRTRQQEHIKQEWNHPEITETRLVGELWQAVQPEDFYFAHSNLRRMAPGVCQIPGPERSVGGGQGGGAVGAAPGVALGSALAMKPSGKLPVAILGDGESFGTIQALWTAAHYQIPMLWVVNNNRSYFNDEAHQDLIARIRNRPPENRTVAMRMENPEVDFAAIAKSFGLHGEGPVKRAEDLGPALHRAIERVKRGQLAMVDVWTEKRQRA